MYQASATALQLWLWQINLSEVSTEKSARAKPVNYKKTMQSNTISNKQYTTMFHVTRYFPTVLVNRYLEGCDSQSRLPLQQKEVLK